MKSWSVRTLAVCLSLSLCSCGSRNDESRAYGPAVPEASELHTVEIHHPETAGVLDTDVLDVHGAPVGVSCTTCHGSGTNPKWVQGKNIPKEFHSKMKVEHGTNSCNSCHDSKDRTKLHLADGKKLDFDQAMTLCAQCHGSQYRDYTKGSHGGMTGYWDLRRGPRKRNSCLDCHSAHSPKYGKVRPVHPPKDRFLEWKQNHEDPRGKDKHE